MYYDCLRSDNCFNLLIDLSFSKANEFIEECKIAKRFNHPNVLSLIGVSIIPVEAIPLMIMPYMYQGDVRSFLRSKRGNTITIENFPKVKFAILYTYSYTCSYPIGPHSPYIDTNVLRCG